jgi:hypothetical protein
MLRPHAALPCTALPYSAPILAWLALSGLNRLEGGGPAGRVVFSQDFRWEDLDGRGRYAIGERGHLAIDGSAGGVRCRRRLERPITDGRGALGLALRFTLGRPYGLALRAGDGTLAARCRIDRDGGIGLENGPDSGRSLTFWEGVSYRESARRPRYTLESDLETLRFAGFDFARGTFALELRGAGPGAPARLAGNLAPGIRDVALLDIELESAGTGSQVRVRELTEHLGGAVVAREVFPSEWRPIPPPPRGMPDDVIQELRYRPLAEGWLEVRTVYGDCTAGFPTAAAGAIEFEWRAPNVQNESSLILEEANGTFKGATRIQLYALEGRLKHSNRQGGGDFTPPVDVVADRIYRVRIGWARASQSYRVWLDGALLRYQGSADIPIVAPGLRQGITNLRLHCGSIEHIARNVRGAAALGWGSPAGVEPALSYWRKFRVTALAEPGRGRSSGTGRDRAH